MQRRLSVLSAHVREQEPPVRRWWTTFAVLHGTMASAAAILAATAQDEGGRNELLVGTVSSTLAIGTLLVFTPALMGGGDALNAMGDDTPEARLAKMRRAEDILSRGAASVDFLHSWVPATLTGAYLAAASSTLLLAFGRTAGAFTHAVGGIVLGMGRILLHPRGARDAWMSYRRAHPDAGCVEAVAGRAPGPRIRFAVQGLGLGLRLTF